MKFRTLAACFSVLALAVPGALPRPAVAEPPHPRQAHAEDYGSAPRLERPTGGLVKLVRDGTRHYRNVTFAEAAGYELHFGCVSSPDEGAMGLHYVNMGLVGDGVLDPQNPEIVIYEPLPRGGRRLIGADYLVLADAWHANHDAAPQLMGQLMHLIPSPNRYGLPAFYTLHVWAWKPNPHGTFTNWHPDVSCDAFAGEGQ